MGASGQIVLAHNSKRPYERFRGAHSPHGPARRVPLAPLGVPAASLGNRVGAPGSMPRHIEGRGCAECALLARLRGAAPPQAQQIRHPNGAWRAMNLDWCPIWVDLRFIGHHTERVRRRRKGAAEPPSGLPLSGAGLGGSAGATVTDGATGARQGPTEWPLWIGRRPRPPTRPRSESLWRRGRRLTDRGTILVAVMSERVAPCGNARCPIHAVQSGPRHGGAAEKATGFGKPGSVATLSGRTSPVGNVAARRAALAG